MTGCDRSNRREAVAVLGAGTMGAGIAWVAALAGAEVVLHDPDGDALAVAEAGIRSDAARSLERGRLTSAQVELALGRLQLSADARATGRSGMVIEAVPERLDLKKRVLAEAQDRCGERTVLATNTSSLGVGDIARTLEAPGRLVGMHFFNPVARMPLVEIAAGPDTDRDAIEGAESLARGMGKTPVRTADTIGFVVNRCARPFYGESLQLLAEGIADTAAIDHITRSAAGFPMGPFELMDLIGLDVNLEIQQSFFDRSHGEPRWRPSPIQARLVAAGHLGRKTGRGFHRYTEGRRDVVDVTREPPAVRLEGNVVINGEGPLSDALRTAAADSGARIADGAENGDISLWIDAGIRPAPVPQHVPACVRCATRSLASRVDAATAAGFHAQPPWDDCRLVELTRSAHTDARAIARSDAFFAQLGRATRWVGDAPGLVTGRLVSQIVNEACFALEERVASRADIELAMRLGLRWPRGPFTWGEEVGFRHVLRTLEALHEDSNDPRYRASELLRRFAKDELREASPTKEPSHDA